MQINNQSHRPAAVAGQFYPANPDSLRAQIAGWLDESANPVTATPPKILMAPHAGYIYSGATAAKAYALLGAHHSRIRRVVLLGPAHRVAVKGLAIPSVEVFDTPLGLVPLDRALISLIADLPQVVVSDEAHASEHSLEVQLPFLQQVLDQFTLVPLIVGRAEPSAVAEVLDRLWGGNETLIIISTDLSHFLTHEQARSRDRQTLQRILALNPTLNPHDACGAMPVNGALNAAAAHGLRPELLGVCNSGDVTGDHSRVVGYAALAFWSPVGEGMSDDEDDHSGNKDQALGSALLIRARNAIAQRLGLPLDDEPHHPVMENPGATFVTLHHQGRLRGCIGRLEAGAHSLDADVRQNAHRAAFEDPRFAPVSAAEWHGLHVEVSVLDPPQTLSFDSEAEALAILNPGVDGVIFSWRHYRSTFLPQVWEQLPRVDAFMAALKRKAGLPEDFWADDVQLARYQVRLFRENVEGVA